MHPVAQRENSPAGRPPLVRIRFLSAAIGLPNARIVPRWTEEFGVVLVAAVPSEVEFSVDSPLALDGDSSWRPDLWGWPQTAECESDRARPGVLRQPRHLGGCISVQGPSLDVQDCRFEDNWAELGGAACCLANGFLACSGLKIQAYELTGDQAYGGGLYKSTAESTLIHGKLALGNSSNMSRGGEASFSHLKRCVVSSHWACSAGARPKSTPSPPAFSATERRIWAASTTPVWSGTTLQRSMADPPTSSTASWSWGIRDAANLSLIPLVSGPTGSDARLTLGSPCIDAGNPSVPPGS